MEENKFEKGGISVETEHIFPIIKRWLYSDKEIFLRELISNACDAITKRHRLVSLGEASDAPAGRIDVVINSEAGTLTVCDNGLGMSADEIKRYINQIALSGALDFIQKYEDEKNDSGIIGHFGLGFYSAFMVADTVEILTKSYVDAEPAVHWSCTEGGEYQMENGEKAHVGTDIVLHINESEKEFLDGARIRGILEKYCAFMPVEIYLDDLKNDTKEVKEESPVNDTEPLWQKAPSACEEKEYNEFYKKVFSDYSDPLFYIHINADYPLNFKGILYFPKLAHEFANMEGQVKLYYNQVFVADNIKEVIPEYLLMLKGVLDCPELPLNVSRSYLQNSGYVSKISAHIIKKVCDKLNSLFNNERETYEKFWNDIKPFVEYGCMRDKKFYDRVKDIILFKTTDGKYMTLSEYTEKNKEKAENTVYYANDKTQQARYIKLFADEAIDVVLFETLIDTQFINYLENENDKLKFKRIDSGLSDSLKEDTAVENQLLKELFAEATGKKAEEISFAKLKNEKTPAVITIPEEQRRFADMMKLYSKGESFPMPDGEENLVVNVGNALIMKIEALLAEPDKKDTAKKLAFQAYMLALISQRALSAKELDSFVSETSDFLSQI